MCARAPLRRSGTARARLCPSPRLSLAPPHSRVPQNLIFRFLQSKQRIVIWLFENTELRIEGRLIVRRALSLFRAAPVAVARRLILLRLARGLTST